LLSRLFKEYQSLKKDDHVNIIKVLRKGYIKSTEVKDNYYVTKFSLNIAVELIRFDDSSKFDNNIEESINILTELLEINEDKSLTGIIFRWLGNAFFDRRIGNRTENLKKSVEYYQLAKEYYLKNDDKEELSPIRFGLIKVYIDLIETGMEQYITEGIDEALKIRKELTKKDDFNKIAECERVLGELYFWIKSEENIKNSIWHYEEALMLFENIGEAEDIAATHDSLGCIYSSFPLEGKEYKQKAIEHFNIALQMFKDMEDYEYAETVKLKLEQLTDNLH
jgi:tetratricopeptide (TPR) repeat protein